MSDTRLTELITKWRQEAERHKTHGDCYRIGQGWGLAQCADELEAALASPSPWRDISSAPKDQPVLLWGRIWSRWSNVEKADVTKWHEPGYYIGEVFLNDDGRPTAYVDAGFVTGDSAECWPTHWMPLPAPPPAERQENR